MIKNIYKMYSSFTIVMSITSAYLFSHQQRQPSSQIKCLLMQIVSYVLPVTILNFLKIGFKSQNSINVIISQSRDNVS